jgi:transposase-like protein
MKVDTSMKEHIAEKIDGLIVGRKRDGRNIYSSAGKRALIHACLQPGISVAGSALANGVNANLLRKWILRYQGRQSSKKPAAKSNHRPLPLLPIHLTDPPSLPTPTQSPTVTHESAKPVEAQNNQIEIEIAGAKLTLRGDVDARQLRTVLACLARV